MTSTGVPLWRQLQAAAARELHLGGLTFSDELGGFRLLAGHGSGTEENPGEGACLVMFETLAKTIAAS